MSKTRGNPLATLGRVWRQREDRIRQGVVAASGEVALLRAGLARLRQAMEAGSEAVRMMLDGAETPLDMTGYRRQVSELRTERSVQGRRLSASEQVLALRRVELAGAIRQRRALERLARKRSAAAAATDQRLEQKELDDLHAVRTAAETPGRDEQIALTGPGDSPPVMMTQETA